MTKKRNPIARVLRSKSLRARMVRPKRGAGSYSRKGRKRVSRRVLAGQEGK